MTNHPKIKVLISAYACEPHKGSEPGVGWNWAKQIAKFAEVWVITRANNEEVIEEELSRNPEPNLHFVYVDLPKWLRFWKKKQRGVRTYYYLWQLALLQESKRLHRLLHFALVHHVTFVNDWLPSSLALLKVPFVWGPIGSNPPFPSFFQPNRKSFVLEQARVLTQKIFRVFDPFFYITLFRAEQIIPINRQIQEKYPFSLLNTNKYSAQSAISVDVLRELPMQRKEPGNCSIVSVGRLIYIKGFHLALKSFAQASRKMSSLTLKVIGDGTERKNLEEISLNENLADKIFFLGNISRENVVNEMNNSDIFLFPSFEGGGMVVLEAMAAGLPVVCLDYGGPGEMVTDECGIKVKPINSEQTIQDLSDALLKLANDPELRKQMGEAGRKRVEEHYTWEKKGEFIKQVYEEVLGYRL
jgi:glycosyltransferase involved in cell wall biosynthesis